MVCHSSGAGCSALRLCGCSLLTVRRSSPLSLLLSLLRLGRSSRRAGLILFCASSSLPFERGGLVFACFLWWLRSRRYDRRFIQARFDVLGGLRFAAVCSRAPAAGLSCLRLLSFAWLLSCPCLPVLVCLSSSPRLRAPRLLRSPPRLLGSAGCVSLALLSTVRRG